MTTPETTAGRSLVKQAGDWDYFGTAETDKLGTWVDRIEREATLAAYARVREAVGDVPGIGLAPHRDVSNHAVIFRSAVIAAIDEMEADR